MDSEIIKKEELLQIVLNNIPSFIFWKDRKSVYQGCNHNFAISAGFNSPNDIKGKTDYDLPWSDAQSAFFIKVDDEVMSSGESQINFEEPQTIANGETRWLRTSKIPLRDNNGKVIGILGSYEDITERKKMELELISTNTSLKELNAQLESTNLDLEQFAYATTHDLRDPIVMMGGLAGLLKRDFEQELGEKGNKYLDYVIEGTQRMEGLVNQLLKYSQISQSHDEFLLTNFNDIMNEVKDEFMEEIQSKNAILKINLPNKEIMCQPNRIKMLFANLLSNGIKFNKSESPTISIDYSENDKLWEFSVSDNGIGIDTNYQEYVFKPFKRLNTRDKFKGSGIGLSIARRIVKLHKGDIHFEQNTSGEGTIFHFTICKHL